ncbi:hypothetical protein N7X28_28465 [Bacillus sp. SM-B1]|uniref:hypothetical protein n=1 Tax=Bacillus sp. SM-B1 TaxID=2980102 RepID=UPI00294A5341|nr:hypothetical protein [Bacillus sp. SM-B1]MDV6040354.1 hypothetical protein [Bacillus sp. SM-B1]
MSYIVEFDGEKHEITDWALTEECKEHEKKSINKYIDENEVVSRSTESEIVDSDYGEHIKVTYIFRRKSKS